MNRFFYIFILLLLAFPSFGQVNIGNDQGTYLSPTEYELGPVRVEGAPSYDPNALVLIAGLRTGDKVMVPGDTWTRAIQNLWDQKIFSNVEIYIEKVIGNVIFPVIKVTTRPRLDHYTYTPLSTIKNSDTKKLRDIFDLYHGKYVTESLIDVTKKHIKDYFADKGYLDCKVDIKVLDDTTKDNFKVFEIDIQKGRKVVISKINIFGNESIKPMKLRKAMKDTKMANLWNIFNKSRFYKSNYEKDKGLMIGKFNEIGLRDARVVKDSIYRNSKGIVIDIYVEEGDKYYFGDITWVGNARYTDGFLDTVLGIKNGDIYNKALLDQRLFMSQDGRDITSLYMDFGYLFFRVEPVEIKVEDHKIYYEMRISEGKQARIRNIIIKGNTKTNDHVVLREIRTKPGDLFNRNDIIRTQRELAQLGFFDPEQFNVNPIPNPQNGTVDIEYTVVEKSSDQIELSGGWGGGRLIGTLGLSFNNFSLKNMFKKGAWSPLPTGDGQKLSIRGQTNGKFYQSYNFSFTEPWLGGKKPNSFTFSLFHSLNGNGEKRSSPTYQGVGITGVAVGLGKRLKWPDDYFSDYWELNYQYYDLNNYSGVFAFANGYSNNISLKYVITRSSVDQPIYPRSGSRFVFTAKATLPYSLFDGRDDYADLSSQDLNKYAEYFKLKFTAEWFLPLTPDRKLVLYPKFGFGFLGYYNKDKGISSFERFYFGGSGLTGFQLDGREIIALRGYGDQSISSPLGDPIIAKLSVELRYPISLNPQATIYVLAFAEAGNTWPSFKQFAPFDLKYSAGLGARIYLPMFGLLGVDYGFGFTPLDAHSSGYVPMNTEIYKNGGWRGQFHFTIGMNLGEL
ncbi:MAG: outer membrane protein assembly factor BamA [Crocinitomicaceae bacterium]|nr:outer membrane protein assembly factor BamA [Crocinitomicaceae bacterium]